MNVLLHRTCPHNHTTQCTPKLVGRTLCFAQLEISNPHVSVISLLLSQSWHTQEFSCSVSASTLCPGQVGIKSDVFLGDTGQGSLSRPQSMGVRRQQVSEQPTQSACNACLYFTTCNGCSYNLGRIGHACNYFFLQALQPTVVHIS